MNKKTLLKGFIKEALTSEMKLDVAGAQAFPERKTSFELMQSTPGDPTGDSQESGIGDLEGDDLSCPECGGAPGVCDPMCPEGGDSELGPDPDRYRH